MRNSYKQIVTYIFLLLLFLGCGVGKTLTRNSARTTVRKEIDMTSNIRRDEYAFTEKAMLFRDSGSHIYQVIIYPKDSFSYSIKDGFRGKAVSIELSGLANHISKGNIYESGSKNILSDHTTSMSEKTKNDKRSVSKELTRRSRIILIVIVAAITIFIGWCCWKFR